MWRAQVAFAVGLMLAAFGLLIAPGFTGTERARPELIGPTVFPRIALGGLIVLLALIALREFVKRHEQDAAPIEFDVLRTGFVIVWTLAYIWTISIIGFPIATLLFQIGFLFAIFRMHSLIRLAAVSIPLSAVYTVFFAHVLQIPLSRGVGPFYWLNAALY